MIVILRFPCTQLTLCNHELCIEKISKGLSSKFLFFMFYNFLWNCVQGHNFDCNASICSNKHGQTHHESFIITSQTIYYIYRQILVLEKIEICSITLYAPSKRNLSYYFRGAPFCFEHIVIVISSLRDGHGSPPFLDLSDGHGVIKSQLNKKLRAWQTTSWLHAKHFILSSFSWN